jgi:glutathione S-transferase
MKLHMHPVSSTSRPVMLLIAVADIPVESVLVDLMKGEHHNPAFVKLNPSREVPVLEDGDFVMAESSAIMKYLADKVNSPLYPKDLKQRARINERMDWFNTKFYRDWAYNMIYPQLFPHHKRATDEHTAATIEWGKTRSAAALTQLEQDILGDNKFVCGDTMTIADLFGAQFVCLGDIVRTDFDKYAKTKGWIGRMKALPAWKKVNEVAEGFAASLADKPLVTV